MSQYVADNDFKLPNVFLLNPEVTEIMYLKALCRPKRQALGNIGEFWSQ